MLSPLLLLVLLIEAVLGADNHKYSKHLKSACHT
jgi:hypothetical protein